MSFYNETPSSKGIQMSEVIPDTNWPEFIFAVAGAIVMALPAAYFGGVAGGASGAVLGRKLGCLVYYICYEWRGTGISRIDGKTNQIEVNLEGYQNFAEMAKRERGNK